MTLGFGELGCSSQPPDSNLAVGSCGPDNRGTEVNIGFDTRVGEEGVETVTLTVCYDVATSVNIWSRHSLWDEINARCGGGGRSSRYSHDAISRQSADIWGCLKAIGLGQLLVLRKRHRHTRAGRTCLDFVLNTV